MSAHPYLFTLQVPPLSSTTTIPLYQEQGIDLLSAARPSSSRELNTRWSPQSGMKNKHWPGYAERLSWKSAAVPPGTGTRRRRSRSPTACARAAKSGGAAPLPRCPTPLRARGWPGTRGVRGLIHLMRVGVTQAQSISYSLFSIFCSCSW